MKKNTKIILQVIIISLVFLLYSCSSDIRDEDLLTKPGKAWVYENGSQKIAFTLTSSGYQNYIFDYEMDVMGMVNLGFHTNNNILYFHHDWYDEQGNYLGVWGDSLYIAENPGAPTNLYEFEIHGKDLILTKPLYSYINPCQGVEIGDVSYKFSLKSFTPPSNLSNSNVTDFSREIKPKDENLIYIYNLEGKRINDNPTKDGMLVWNGTDYDGNRAPSGVYFAIFKTGDNVYMRDVVMLM